MSSKIHGLSGTYCNFQGLSRPRIFLFLNLRTFKVQFSVKKRTRNPKVYVNSHCKGYLEVRTKPRLKFYRFGTSE